MTHTVDPSTELSELQTQKATAKEAYKKQKQALKIQIKSLKQAAKRSKKISKLETRLDGLKQTTPPE